MGFRELFRKTIYIWRAGLLFTTQQYEKPHVLVTISNRPGLLFTAYLVHSGALSWLLLFGLFWATFGLALRTIHNARGKTLFWILSWRIILPNVVFATFKDVKAKRKRKEKNKAFMFRRVITVVNCSLKPTRHKKSDFGEENKLSDWIECKNSRSLCGLGRFVNH